jgi:2,4-dienoyl-CoA reductase-like NADH-dependent reductase (Old Yellow Enzyme family)
VTAVREQQGPLAQPIAIGGLTVKNRLVATAHGIAAVVDGIPADGDAEYWARLSAGGAGMLVAGGTQVGPESTLRGRNLTEAYRPEALGGLTRRATAMRSAGAAAVIQLGHLGQETLGAAAFYPFVAASPVRSPREPTAHRVLGTEDVQKVVAGFAVSARHSVEAGFDVIEIHAAHGYLIAQFLSRRYNTRADRYGPDPDGRVRLLVEIIEAIRAAAPGTPVGVRLSVEPGADSGLNEEDLLELVPLVQERAHFDYLNLSYGVRGHYVRDMATERPPLLGIGARFRGVLDVPLLLASGFRDLPDAEGALTSGEADLVGMARAHMADPQVAAKWLAGTPETVRPCVACNEDCRTFEPTALCTVNPDLAPVGAVRRPAAPVLIGLPQARGRVRRVAVVGAGPAGLECAVTLAEAGTVDVRVFERSDRIGGQLATAATAPHRDGWQRILDFYQGRCAALGVHVEYDTVIGDPDELARFDIVVWATGAPDAEPDSGWAVPVHSSTAFIASAAGEDVAGRHVVVADDGFGWWPMVSSVERAFASGAAKVTVLTPGAMFAGSLPAEGRVQLGERLPGHDLVVLPFHAPDGTGSDGRLSVRNLMAGSVSSLDVDLVVAVGERLANVAPGTTRVTTRAIGDCVVPRKVAHAIADGRQAAVDILESDTGSSPVRP